MTSFIDLGLNSDILKRLEKLKFETPTPIQEKTIPHILESKRDLIGLAQTGTGKTAAFGLPIVNLLDPKIRKPQAIILCPTRELCLQIARDMKNFVSPAEQSSILAVYGGESITTQISALRRGVQIVVGTPGRVLDVINRKCLDLHLINWLVLDEADEMLDMGFKEDLDAILAKTNVDKQVLLFSATMQKSVYSIAKKYMKDPLEISVGKKNMGADNVTHEYYVVRAEDRYEALRRIVDSNPDIYGILFCRTRNETQVVADKLIQDHYSAEALHGDVSQNQRTQIMNRFRNKRVQLLVATDVAARGIDVSDLTHVINYNLPDTDEIYIHRTGRTGRAQKNGCAVSLINHRELYRIKNLERIVGKLFKQNQIPNGKSICEKQLDKLIDKIINVDINESAIAEFLPGVHDKLKELTKEELIKKVVSYEFSHFLSLYDKAVDLNTKAASFARPSYSSGTADHVLLKIDIGRDDGLMVKDLLGLINRNGNLRNVKVGNIKLLGKQTLFEVPKDSSASVITYLKTASFRKHRLNAVISNDIQIEDRGRFDRYHSKDKAYGAKSNHYHKNKFSKKFKKKF